MAENMNCLVVLDTETTGLDPQKAQILTIDGTIVEIKSEEWIEHETRFHGQIELMDWATVSEKAMETNGIELSNWKGDKEKRVVYDLVQWVRTTSGDGYRILSGWNVGFDRKFLEAAFMRAGFDWTRAFSFKHLDGMQLVRWATFSGAIPQLENDKLETVAKHLGVWQAGAHDSSIDVRMTVDSIKKLTRLFT